MKTLFDTPTLAETLKRLEHLQPTSPRQWGKMDAAQMLAHCCIAMEMTNGTKIPKRTTIGYILGPIFKSIVVKGESPFRHNSPTDPSFIVTDAHDFSREKERLYQLVKAFGEGGEAKITTHTHSFFGPLTPKEWGQLAFKHIDHHLRQFSC
jgi:hypothetical protein